MKHLTIAFFIAIIGIFYTTLLKAQCTQSTDYNNDYVIVTPAMLGLTDANSTGRTISAVDISSQLGYPSGFITVSLEEARNTDPGSGGSNFFYIIDGDIDESSHTKWTFGGTLKPHIWIRHGSNLAPNSKDGFVALGSNPLTFVQPGETTTLPTGFSHGTESPPPPDPGTLYYVENSSTTTAGTADMYWRSNGVYEGSDLHIHTTSGGTSAYFIAIQKNTCALPVTFDKLSASFTNEKLDISWSTLQEANNSHFDIMASANGVAFKKIGTINSKSTDGNSDMTLNYSYSINTTQAFALMGSFALSLFILGFARNNKKLSAVLFFVISLLFFYSCQKSDRKTIVAAGSAVYLKVIQVDKDGTFKESKTIKAIKKG